MTGWGAGAGGGTAWTRTPRGEAAGQDSGGAGRRAGRGEVARLRRRGVGASASGGGGPAAGGLGLARTGLTLGESRPAEGFGIRPRGPYCRMLRGSVRSVLSAEACRLVLPQGTVTGECGVCALTIGTREGHRLTVVSVVHLRALQAPGGPGPTSALHVPVTSTTPAESRIGNPRLHRDELVAHQDGGRGRQASEAEAQGRIRFVREAGPEPRALRNPLVTKFRRNFLVTEHR